MSYNSINYRVTEAIATIELNRPDKLNAVDLDMRRELPDALTQAAGDDDVRAIIITGAGRGFCAGADLTGPSADKVSRKKTLELVAEFVEVFTRVDKPIIAAVNGAAAGVGLSLALCCDIRIASSESKFAAIWVKRGLVADGGASLLLPALVGMEFALELAFTGRMVLAQEAKDRGMVSRVVEPADLLPEAMRLASEIAAQPPITVELIKRIMTEGTRREFHQSLLRETYAQNICRGTQDHKEAVRAFVEKRRANFKGE